MSRPSISTGLLFVFVVMLLPAAIPISSADDNGMSAPRRRLPNYYGQIGISDRQRERIYGLQAEYNSEIEELQAQIDTLKAERDAEIESVLTDVQKRRLDVRKEEARLAREARRAAME